MANIRTQGTNVWAFDGTALTKLTSIKTLDLATDSTTKIENTPLEETKSKSYLPGLSDPGEGSIGIDLDTENLSHTQMIAWAEQKKKLTFYVGASDGTAEPTVTTGTVTVPTGRSFWSFDASLTSPQPKFDADALVGYTFTLQRSTAVTLTAKTV